MDRWIIQSAGSVGKSYSLDQLRTMVSGSLLNPGDMVAKEGGSEAVRVGDLLESAFSQESASEARPPAPKPRPRTVLWLVLGAGLLALTTGGGASIYFATRPADLPPDLPEWFDPAYRVPKKRAIIFPSRSGDKAKYDGKTVGPPGKYDDEWLDKHFTHYIGTQNAFLWVNPKGTYPSDGKIMAGIKVVAGPEVGNLVLVCVLTEDGRPENMFVPTETLQERSKGPPRIEK